MTRESSHSPRALALRDRLRIENALTDYEQACARLHALSLPQSLIALPGLERFAQILPPTTPLNVLADLAWKTGLRAPEALRLQWLDVGFADDWLYVHGDHTTLRKVPLPGAVKDRLLRLRQTASPGTQVFSDHCQRSLPKDWHRVMQSIDLAQVCLHHLRLDYAAQQLAAGVNPNLVAERLGWRDSDAHIANPNRNDPATPLK